MLKNYNCVIGQSLFDICLNTYGSLDLFYKLLQDSGIDNAQVIPYGGQNFIYDDSLIVNQNINQNYVLTPVRYATSIGNNGSSYYIVKQTKDPSINPPGPFIPNPVTTPTAMYTMVALTSFTSGSDGTTIITLMDKDGNSMIGNDIVSVILEIHPCKNSDYSWQKTTGIITLLGGLTLDLGQTLYAVYSKLIIP